MTDTENPVRVHPTLDKLTIRLDQLRPRKGNPRRGNIDAIAESLERNGQYRPVVVNKPTGEILAGNHTYAAAKRLGWTHIAATFVDVDEDHAARIVLADNRTADLGDYDDTLLLDMLKDLDGDLLGTGYNQDDADALAALGSAGVADLDDLADQYGEPTPDDFLSSVMLRLDLETAGRWNNHRDNYDSDTAALATLLDKLQ